MRQALKLTLGVIGSLSLLYSMFLPWWSLSVTVETLRGVMVGTVEISPLCVRWTGLGLEGEIYPWGANYEGGIWTRHTQVLLAGFTLLLLLAGLRGLISSFSKGPLKGGVLGVLLPAMPIGVLLLTFALFDRFGLPLGLVAFSWELWLWVGWFVCLVAGIMMIVVSYALAPQVEYIGGHPFYMKRDMGEVKVSEAGVSFWSGIIKKRQRFVIPLKDLKRAELQEQEAIRPRALLLGPLAFLFIKKRKRRLVLRFDVGGMESIASFDFPRDIGDARKATLMQTITEAKQRLGPPEVAKAVPPIVPRRVEAAELREPAPNLCPDCGYENRPVARFCVKCGAKLVSESMGGRVPSEGTRKATVESALKQYHRIEGSKDLKTFINRYGAEILIPMIESIDIPSLPVKVDSPGMHGMQCMKILELSRWLREADRKEEMRACYKKLSELCDMDWREDNSGVYCEVMFGLGMDLMIDGNDEMAYRVLESIRAHGFKLPDAIAWQGACALNMGDKSKAREHFREVLKIDPSHRMANDLIKRC